MPAPPSLYQAIARLRVARLGSALGDGESLAEIDATLAALGRNGAHDARLARMVELSPAALDFIWTAVALEIEPGLFKSAVALAGPEVRRGATLALHVAAFKLDDEKAEALAAELDRHRDAGVKRILFPAQEGELLPAVPFVVPRRVRSFLLGREDVEPLVTRFGGVRVGDGGYVSDPHQRQADALLERALDGDDDHLVLVEGPPGVGRARAVARAAHALGRPVVEIDLARWEARLAPLEDLLAAWWRECALRDAIGLIAHADALRSEAREERRLSALIDGMSGMVAVTVRGRGFDLGLRRPVVRVAFPIPEHEARRELWRQAAGRGQDVDVELLAHRFRMGAGGIQRATRAARLASEDSDLTTAALIDGVRSSVGERLGDLAFTVPVTHTWKDLVVPEDVRDQLRGLIARVGHAHQVYDSWGFGRGRRGQGVAAILSGPPGTGKTMSAGLIAHALQLDLLQVDLSRVVSKWIGETEKQLANVFDAAEAGHALLLFDEADALFAKRTTDVKGAADRYANLEVNYLLQRIEAFGGITILTTNLETAIDPAVKRRLAAHIVFPHPDEAEREDLWRRMLPPLAPVAGEIDFHGLAVAFPQLTGAHIRNATVSAAFTAAASRLKLTQQLLRAAAVAEYRALGRVISDKRSVSDGG